MVSVSVMPSAARSAPSKRTVPKVPKEPTLGRSSGVLSTIQCLPVATNGTNTFVPSTRLLTP